VCFVFSRSIWDVVLLVTSGRDGDAAIPYMRLLLYPLIHSFSASLFLRR
jgi:hypothetical protein